MGSTLVYLSLIFVVYRAGMPGYYIGIVLAGVALAVAGLILPLTTALLALGILAFLVFLFLPKQRRFLLYNAFFTTVSAAIMYGVGFVMEQILAPHQQVRIKVLLGLENDPSGAGYNTLQSLIAIGSGGWTGKGFLNGTQTKLDFVPAQSTDYIFCTVGEEWGFLGTFLLMLAFGLLIGRIIWLAERQKDNFSRFYGYGVASIFFTHWVINIGMTIGLFPTVGIPLPFFSYGGSSLWGFHPIVVHLYQAGWRTTEQAFLKHLIHRSRSSDCSSFNLLIRSRTGNYKHKKTTPRGGFLYL